MTMEQNNKKIVTNILKQFLTTYMSHFDFEEAVKDFPIDSINQIPENSPFSFWELLEHIRRMLNEIQDYIINQNYKYIPSPTLYWPEKSADPISTEAWENTIEGIRETIAKTVGLLDDPSEDIFSELKYQKGSGHTLLRQVLMVIDHNSYHIGQFILMRKLLNIWH